jgi:transcriptional regulator with XRE-family HTH domain
VFKKHRRAKGFSQKQLAFESGIVYTQIAKLELGKLNPTLTTIFILARTLDIPISELFKFELPPFESEIDTQKSP